MVQSSDRIFLILPQTQDKGANNPSGVIEETPTGYVLKVDDVAMGPFRATYDEAMADAYEAVKGLESIILRVPANKPKRTYIKAIAAMEKKNVL